VDSLLAENIQKEKRSSEIVNLSNQKDMSSFGANALSLKSLNFDGSSYQTSEGSRGMI
jgi:hypothetical protein